MEGISDICIIGIDETRPPRIRKEPYIDIFFKLSHQAPADWCKDFNNLVSSSSSSAKIVEKEGLFIETWVRSPDDIIALLQYLKDTVMECTEKYIQRIELSAKNALQDNSLGNEVSGEQGRLNQIIASLEFSQPDS